MNGCPYEIDLCIICSPIGYNPESVSVTGFKQIPTNPACVQTLTANQVLNYIETVVTNPDYYYTYICTNAHGAPPCPDQSPIIEQRHFSCWYAELIDYFGEQSLYYRPCNTNEYCYEKISWCYDKTSNSYTRTIVDGPRQIGSPSCTKEEWEVTLPILVGFTSQCFIMHNDCNP